MRSRNSTFDTSGKRMLSWDEAARYTGLGRTTHWGSSCALMVRYRSKNDIIHIRRTMTKDEGGHTVMGRHKMGVCEAREKIGQQPTALPYFSKGENYTAVASDEGGSEARSHQNKS